MLLLHYTGMPTPSEALDALCDPQRKVSAHYFIEEDGGVIPLVAEERRAWHAGKASWRGSSDINARSIGIELVNPGHEWGYRDFPEAQMQALVSLGKEIMARHPIPARHVLGHSDVAPHRKQDPGERFDWERLAKEGIGLWVGRTSASPSATSLSLEQSGSEILQLRHELHRFGYGVDIDVEHFDENLQGVVAAFQRHFRPWKVDGIADGESRGVLRQLLDRI